MSPKKRWQDLLGARQGTLQRLLLALSFLIILTCFLQLREVRIDILEMETSAPRYVIAQTDFSFLDEEATHTLKQESVRDIGAIYKIDESQLLHRRRDVENSLIEHPQWRQDLQNSTFEEAYTMLAQIEGEMLAARFTDSRTLNKIPLLKTAISDFYQIPSPPHLESVLPQSLWDEIQQKLVEKKMDSEALIRYLLKDFSHQEWVLQEDFTLERSIRAEVQSVVPNRYTHVYAGSQIIKKGEQVTARHIAMVQAMKNALDEARHLWSFRALLGSALIALCLTMATLFYLYYFHRALLQSMQKMVLLAIIIVMSLILAKCIEFLLLNES